MIHNIWMIIIWSWVHIDLGWSWFLDPMEVGISHRKLPVPRGRCRQLPANPDPSRLDQGGRQGLLDPPPGKRETLGKHGKTCLGSQSLGTGTIDMHMEMRMEIYIYILYYILTKSL